MKTSFLGKGKFKLVLFATLCAVVLGCAIFLCFNIYSNNNSSAENSEITQTEIVAPELEAKATATTSVTAPAFIESGGTTLTLPPSAHYMNARLGGYDSTYMTYSGPLSNAGGVYYVSFTSNRGGTYSVTFTAKSGYTLDGASSVTLTLTITAYSVTAPTFNGGGTTKTLKSTDHYMLANVQDYDSTYMTFTGPLSSAGGVYYVSFTSNRGGTYSVTFTAKSGYTLDGASSVTLTLTVTSDAIAISPDFSYSTITYGSNSGTPTVTGNTGGGTVTWSIAAGTGSATINSTTGVISPTKAGTVTVTMSVAAKDNYASGTKTKSVTINARSVSSATVTLETTSYTYDGTEKKPTTSVKVGSTTLTANTDYTVTYSNNKNAGTAKVTVTGKGNYTGSIVKEFTINPRNISNASFGEIGDKNYNNGLEIKPTPTITDTALSATLAEGTDFTFSYANNTNAGQATVTVTGTGNYTGTKSTTFTIIGLDISECVIGTISDCTYNGTAQTPTATVTLNGTTLSSVTDFTFSYTENINVGEATLTVTGKGNYSGKASKKFTIVPRSIMGATVADIAAQSYTGNAVEPLPRVTDLGRTLTKDTDYTLSYEHNIEMGAATVIITGKGNFAGTLTANFKIVADINKVTVTGIDLEYGWTGAAITPEPSLTLGGVPLVKGTDYTLEYTDNTDLGIATVTIKGIGNYNSTKTVTFKIVAVDIADATLSGIDKNYAYTGSAITPEPQLVLNGKTLVKDTDFTVTYRNNIDLGAAVIEINGIGNYTGTKSTAFTIIKANIGTAQVDSVNPAYEQTGSAIEPPPVVTLNGVTLVKDRDYTVKYENNVEIGTATYVITGIGNYEGSITGSFKITIALPEVEVDFVSYNGTDKLFAGKALPEITATATYNGATVEGTLSWDLKEPILEEGTHDYYWTFTPADVDNFAVVTGYKTLTAEKPNYVAIRAEWRSGSQPELFTSSTIAFLKQNLKITGIFSSGDVEEIVGGYALVGSWDSPEATNTVKMPVNGGDDFTVTVNFGAWSDTIVSVVIQDVILKEITVDPAEGKEIKTEYTALDGFDVSSVVVTAKYNDGSEKVLPSGNNGYSVVYEKGADSLQFGDTKVTFSFTDNGVTKTVEINGLTVAKKPLDKPLVFTPEDIDYNYGKPVTDGIGLKDLPDWINVTYVYEDEEGNILDPSAVKNAGKYKVTAKFTVDKNHEDIDDITATFEIKKLTPVLNPSVGGSLSVGKSLSELTVVAGGEAPAGKLTWDNAAYQLQEGVNKCYYTFTPDDTVNFNVVHGFVEVTASGVQTPAVNGAGLVGWQIALIIICLVVVTIALIALTVALKSRRAATDSDGFYDDASPEDMN